MRDTLAGMTQDAGLGSEHKRNSGIQSISRLFAVLEAMADAGGIASVTDLAARSDLPLPTIHRLLRTLVSLGYARQEPNRQYALGPRLAWLGEAASRLVESWATPHLRQLADLTEETASYAVLDGTDVVYVAQAPGRQSMRMVNEIGHRLGIHCTATGKAILAALPPDKAAKLIHDTEFHIYTHRTITSADALVREVEAVRERGYALDVGEQEIGVSAVAVALPDGASRGAVSVSGPQARMGDDIVERIVPALANTARKLYNEMTH
jgi:IclR family acetate operon transcriptional repressor